MRRASPWLAAGLVLAVVASVGGARGVPFLSFAPSVGYAHPAAANETIYLVLTDGPAFDPRSISAAPGDNVSVHLNNTGLLPHSFTLSSQSGVLLNRSWTPADLNESFASYPPIANVSVPAGHERWANFSIAKTASLDSFEFVSQVPYQFQAGMWGFLNISSSSPGLVLSDNATNSFSFQPAALSAQPAQFPANVIIKVTNLGGLAHTFTVVAQPDLNITTVGWLKDHPPLANATIPSEAGKSGWANFSIPAKGIYEFVCTVPGHFENGMFGYLYAGVPVPTGGGPPSSAIVETWVLAGSAILLGIGAVFLVVAGFAGRFPRSPPSQHGGA
ncbi:MAG: hypothetical protein ACLP78_08340 [Thermoplasmata archaeon]